MQYLRNAKTITLVISLFLFLSSCDSGNGSSSPDYVGVWVNDRGSYLEFTESSATVYQNDPETGCDLETATIDEYNADTNLMTLITTSNQLQRYVEVSGNELVFGPVNSPEERETYQKTDVDDPAEQVPGECT